MRGIVLAVAFLFLTSARYPIIHILILITCERQKPVQVRIFNKTFTAHCDTHKVGMQMSPRAIRCPLQKLSDLGLPCLSRPFGRQVEPLPQCIL